MNILGRRGGSKKNLRSNITYVFVKLIDVGQSWKLLLMKKPFFSIYCHPRRMDFSIFFIYFHVRARGGGASRLLLKLKIHGFDKILRWSGHDFSMSCNRLAPPPRAYVGTWFYVKIVKNYGFQLEQRSSCTPLRARVHGNTWKSTKNDFPIYVQRGNSSFFITNNFVFWKKVFTLTKALVFAVWRVGQMSPHARIFIHARIGHPIDPKGALSMAQSFSKKQFSGLY